MATVKGPLGLVRGAYDFDTKDYDPGVDCTGYVGPDGEWFDTPSMTKQASKDECDINFMMARYQSTGVFDNVNQAQPQWGDFSSVSSYQDAQNIILDSQRAFASLSAEVRARFGNDPAQMLRFVGDDKNYDEAVRLGLVERPPATSPDVAAAVEGSGETSPPKAAVKAAVAS